MLFLGCHLLVGLLDVALFLDIHRRPTPRVAARAVAVYAVCALPLCALLALTLGRSHHTSPLFPLTGCLARLLFVHAPLLALVSSWRLWSAARRTSLALAASALVLVAFAIFAFWIEPTRLEVTRHTVSSEKVTERTRVVVLADVQTDRVGAFERRAFALALAEEPDLVVLPGDFVQAPLATYARELEAWNELLLELGFADGPPLVAVPGNVERPGWEAAFAGTRAVLFDEPGTTELAGLTVSGLPMRRSFARESFLPRPPGFHVIVGHAPDFAREDRSGDLYLAGHIHGGQVQLPGLGPLVTFSSVPRAWATGRTELPQGGTLFVSRGIGMERGYAPRLRFLCRPEIVVIDVVPE